MNVVTYYRISKKGTGLGLESQKDYCDTAIRQQGWNEKANFTDDGISGALRSRPALDQAISYCIKHDCALLVAKVDRLHRDVEHMASLMKKVKVKIATMPTADNFQINLFAALAQQEREFIASRTKDALAKLQDRANNGDRVSQEKIKRRNHIAPEIRASGTEASAKARSSLSKEYLSVIEDYIHAARAKGFTSLRQIANYMNSKGILTVTGKRWTISTSQRILKEIDNNKQDTL